MTEWKRVRGSVRPAELDTTSSSSTVYMRRNIEEVTTKDPVDGREDTIFEYDERTMSKEEYNMTNSYAIKNVMQTISELEVQIAELSAK